MMTWYIVPCGLCIGVLRSSSDKQSTPSCDKKLEGRGALNSQLKPVLVDIMTHMVMDELDDISCVQVFPGLCIVACS